MHRQRLILVFALALLPLLVVAARAFHLQVVRGEHYEGRAAYRARSAVFLPPMRGRILDREGRVLAESEPVLDLVARPAVLDLEYGLSERMSQVLRVPRTVVVDLVRRGAVLRAPSRAVRSLVRRYPGACKVATKDGDAALAVLPEGLRAGQAALSRLSSFLGIPAGELAARLLAEESRIDAYPDPNRRLAEGMRPVPLARVVPLTVAALVAEDPEAFPGISVEPRQERRYPSGDVAAHLVGWVGRIPAEKESDLRARRLLLDVRRDVIDPETFEEVREGSYSLADTMGRDGIEAAMEPVLRGTMGIRLVERDRAGRLSETILEEDPGHGEDVRLTIDLALQRAAEAAIDRAVRAAASDPGRSGGAIVLMDVRDGSILAMATSPRYPRVAVPGSYKALGADPARPLMSRAMRGELPPGSVFKVVTAVAALESGAIQPGSTVHCSGRYTRWDRGFRCDGIHGDVDVVEAIQRSCNVFFFEMGHRLGRDALDAWAHWFGFGARTGIALRPLDRPGRFPTPEWKEKVSGEPWYPGDNWNLAIGQGDLIVTPLQVARALAAVANSGRLVTPRVLSGGPEPIPADLGIHQGTLALVREALRLVVAAPGGTAFRVAALRDVAGGVAGKTGTAQAGRRGAHAWFAGYAPYDRPEVVVVAVVEHVDPSHHGADAAGPPAAEILSAWWRARGDGPRQ